MKADELFTIDVAAEVATLVGAQLQGSWQIPAEVVRLAVARQAARVEVVREGGGFRFRCDGRLASVDELRALVEVLDPAADRHRRQRAITLVEGSGLSALLWAAGPPGAALEVEVRSGGTAAALTARRGAVAVTVAEADAPTPVTTVTWRCRGLNRRRAVAWLRTALRFVPIPVTIGGRPVEWGFRDGLYRMRVDRPLAAELAVTRSGEAPALWLLEHGVLSARAVVPGYPAFSAALEMSGVAPAGSSAGELRAAANPYLPGLIDRAATMLLLLVDRLPEVEESIRLRLTSLLLRNAGTGVSRDRIMASPILVAWRHGKRRMLTPIELGRSARQRGGIVAAVEPGSGDVGRADDLVLEASAEERGLLSELLAVRIERVNRGRTPVGLGARAAAVLRRGWRAARGLWAPRELPPHRLNPDELGLIEAAAAIGVEVGLCRGAAALCTRRARAVIGRERPEVRAAVDAVAETRDWLYPALLAMTGGSVEIADDVRHRWIDSVDSRR